MMLATLQRSGPPPGLHAALNGSNTSLLPAPAASHQVLLVGAKVGAVGPGDRGVEAGVQAGRAGRGVVRRAPAAQARGEGSTLDCTLRSLLAAQRQHRRQGSGGQRPATEPRRLGGGWAAAAHQSDTRPPGQKARPNTKGSPCAGEGAAALSDRRAGGAGGGQQLRARTRLTPAGGGRQGS